MVAKAKLIVIEGDNEKAELEVDFNPQSLKINHRTTGFSGKENRNKQSQTQGAAQQQTGYSTDLSMELLFDTTESGDDVRHKTLQIVAMIRPEVQPKPGQSGPPAPTVKFQWGTFLFKGNIQSMDETLDFFSEQGVPLRATVNLAINGVSSERSNVSALLGTAGIGLSASVGASAGIGFSASASLNAGIAVGTTPLTLAQAGDTLQNLAGRVGASVSWKAIANANNIDNPRLMQPGTILNLNASAKIGS